MPGCQDGSLGNKEPPRRTGPSRTACLHILLVGAADVPPGKHTMPLETSRQIPPPPLASPAAPWSRWTSRSCTSQRMSAFDPLRRIFTLRASDRLGSCVANSPASSTCAARKALKPPMMRAALRPFLQHGARYCFPATMGGMTRGVPTGYAAEPLKAKIRPGNDPPPVWPSKHGTMRGVAFHPLYPSVPDAAARNPSLGELLSLFDAVRGGSARERALAMSMLDDRLSG